MDRHAYASGLDVEGETINVAMSLPQGQWECQIDGQHADGVVIGEHDMQTTRPPLRQRPHPDRHPPRRVFLSHTAELRALPEPRSFIAAIEAAVSRAGDVVVDMAYLTAQDDTPANVDRDRIAGADVYILLAGFCYGTPVRDKLEQSYTEHEFETAQELGIPRLVFLLSERASGPAGLFVDPLYGTRQARFRQRLRDSGITTTDVLSPDHAETVVFDALMKLHQADLASARRVWSIPARLARFTGRDEQLTRLRGLIGLQPAVVQAVHGMGGVGKTTLALEYAHRHADDYDIVWWVPAEQSDLIPARLAALAHALNLTNPTDSTETAVVRLLGELRKHDRWLLVFDNADNPHVLAPFLPGSGHVLITSRNPHWDALASSVEIGEFTRAESVTLIHRRLPYLTNCDAEKLAEAVGDLPLAVDQAVALLVDTGWTISDYLALLKCSAQRLLDQRDQASGYPLSVAASWQVTFNHLTATDPAAMQLVALAAWLAPEPVPLTVFIGHGRLLPEPLATAVGDPLAWAKVLGVLRRRAIARINADSLLLHRIPAALLRAQSRVTAPECGWAALAVQVLAAAVPADPWNQPATWPACRALLAHVLIATDPNRPLDNVADDLDWLLDRMATYLQTRSQAQVSRSSERAYDRCRSRLDINHLSSMTPLGNFIFAWSLVGEYEPLGELDPTLRGSIVRSGRPNGRWSTIHLGSALWLIAEYEQACEFDRQTLNRRRRIYGDDHPRTLSSANNLAADLRALGDYEQARELDEDTFNRRRRVLGIDHPDTLSSANNVAVDLRALGDYAQASELDDDTFNRRRRILGIDHPDTLGQV